jgi:uncharacterized protein (TIGR03086 family)
MADQIELLERALEGTRRIIANVRSDQYGALTPCAGWNVRTLLNHVLAGNEYFTALARGERPDMAVWSSDHLADGDPAARYEALSKAALDAWRGPGAVDRVANLPSGGPGPRVFDMYLMETAIHGWDLAKATGQEPALDDRLVQAIADAWYGKLPEEVRSGGRVVGPEVACSPDAPVTDRLLAYLGRTP